MRVLFSNISQLVRVASAGEKVKKGHQMQDVAVLENAWLSIQDGRIEATGQMPNIPEDRFDLEVNCSGKAVLPGYVDCHTHLVFPSARSGEFADRIKGLTYEEIAARGGGILNSASKLALLSEDELYTQALERAFSVIASGTTALEIKSGYGLTIETELRILKVIARLKETLPIQVRATFLGAHAFPTQYKNNREGYILEILNEMLPAVAAEGLAEYVDVFCDRGYFSTEDTARILDKAYSLGFKARLHANELGFTGGVQVGVKYNVLSVDHLEHCGAEEIALLKNSNTLPVALPGTSFFLGLPYTPVREMIDEGLAVVLASDFNPGSSPSGNMSFVQSLACLRMKLLPEEALCAVTLNAAAALEWSDSMGSLETGKAANLLISRPVKSFYEIPYYFGNSCIEQVWVNGRKQ